MINIEILVLVIATLIQLLAVYFAYKIYTYNRLSKWWLAIIVALFLDVLRRFTTFLEFAEVSSSLESQISLLEHFILPIVTTLLFTVALWSMAKNFESFEVVEKEAKEKVKEINTRKKK